MKIIKTQSINIYKKKIFNKFNKVIFFKIKILSIPN
jgi:hypothetical protein